ncbi:MAG: hypothetical protein R6U10_00605 [Thermoplasmatota archaeon]
MEVQHLAAAIVALLVIAAPLAGLQQPDIPGPGTTSRPEHDASDGMDIAAGSSQDSSGCKDIVATGDATRDNCSLLLKVRDPSRPGFQVLCTIPAGYEYTYHHPWTGLPMHFTVQHRFIGTTSAKDVPPNVTKPGMLLTDAGLAFGDADTLSMRVNPTRHAWDDFDWMRYAAQSAGTLDEAVELLTEDAVGRLHCTSVPENIFVASPHAAAVVEADAYTYRVRRVDDVAVQSNYPKMLWQTHLLYPMLVAHSFDATFDGGAAAGDVIRLGSLGGIRVVDTGEEGATVRALPSGTARFIPEDSGAPVGSYYVEVHDASPDTAALSMCYKYHAWEDMLMQRITTRQGDITVRDMMDWSRIHDHDVSGLRGMCQGGYEAATVYRLRQRYPATLSSLWYAPDQCSAIYVPVHVCSRDIYDPYESGEAHEVAMQLLERYGHGNLSQMYAGPEQRFIDEVAAAEHEALQLLENGRRDEAVDLLTLTDLRIQMEALAVMRLWLNLSYLPGELTAALEPEIADIWTHDGSREHHEARRLVADALERHPGCAARLRDIQGLLCSVASSG